MDKIPAIASLLKRKENIINAVSKIMKGKI